MRRLLALGFIAALMGVTIAPAQAGEPVDNQLAQFCGKLTKEVLNLHPECNTIKHL